MARIVNAPFLRARPLGFERVAPSPLAARAAEAMPDEPHAGERRGAVHARRKGAYLRRTRPHRPQQG